MKFNKAYIAKIRSTAVIQCATKQEKVAVLNLLKGAKETLGDVYRNLTIQNVDMDFSLVGYTSGIWTAFGCSSLSRILASEFLTNALLESELISLKLNDEYTASFNPCDDFVQVGCQRIPVATLEKLVAEIKRVS